MSVHVSPDALTRFCKDIFSNAGVPEQVAGVVAQSLVYADLRGVESHGVVRTPIYLRRVAEGMIDPHQGLTVEHDSGAAVLVDGGNNFGAYVGLCALDLAIERARRNGACVLGVKGSNHYGTGAFYASKAVKQGMVFIAASNASQTMPPTGGIRPFLGTNPLTIGFPTGNDEPFILDMATSLVARGKIIMAAKRGNDIPTGWAVDKAGLPTNDAAAALDGAVLPMGGPKGFGLAMAIDILSGVLTGAGYGPGVKNMYENWAEPQNVGHFFILVDVSKLMPLDAFERRIQDYISLLKQEPHNAETKELLYAGEIEHRLEVQRRRDGIELPDQVATDLMAIGEQFQLDLVCLTS